MDQNYKNSIQPSIYGIPELDKNIIPVTRPYLPPLEEFIPYLREIWDTQWLTNNGPFHQRLEKDLSSYLGVEHISLFANGTIALVTALQALGVTGEVITTPFSFVATAHAIKWNNLTPVFADIDPETMNLDPKKVESAITPQTRAILPVHCYGRLCNVDRFAEIAKKHRLKLIYDAAHAFSIRDTGGSVLRHGDLSVLSFHATKVFTTFEGGAIISPNAETKRYIDHLKNFGFVDELSIAEVGINGKMCEVQAAFGLMQLKHMEEVLEKRRALDAQYRARLKAIPGIRLLEPQKNISINGAYFPVLIEENYPMKRDALYAHLKQNNIYARRYFYPLISNMQMYRALQSSARNNLLSANRIAEQVICLPIYDSMTVKEVDLVVKIISNSGH